MVHCYLPGPWKGGWEGVLWEAAGVRVQDQRQSTGLSPRCLQAAHFSTVFQAHFGTSCCRGERQAPQK